jgi:hypothetical protein
MVLVSIIRVGYEGDSSVVPFSPPGTALGNPDDFLSCQTLLKDFIEYLYLAVYDMADL